MGGTCPHTDQNIKAIYIFQARLFHPLSPFFFPPNIIAFIFLEKLTETEP